MGRFLILFLSLICFLSFHSEIMATPQFCRDLVISKPAAFAPKHNPTANFTSYLEDLLEERLIGLSDLRDMWSGIQSTGQIRNVLGNRTSTVDRVHADGMQLFIDQGGIRIWHLEDWLKARISEEEVLEKDRSEQQQQTRSTFKPLEFHPVKGGTFMMGDLQKTHESGQFARQEVTLGDFEMMSTKVTVYQYTLLMGDNDAVKSKEFLDPEDITSVSVNGRRYDMAPDSPMYRVSWFEAIEFANRLSRLHGYEPVYKTEYLEDDKGRVKAILSLSQPHRSIYEVEGYRLPTQAEQEFVRRNRGAATGDHFFNNDTEELLKYIYQYEIPYRNHVVDLGLPLMIDGFPFWDLYGHIGEWSLDGFGHYGEFDANEPRLLAKVGSFRGHARTAYEATTLGTEYQDSRVGFRLVRSLPRR